MKWVRSISATLGATPRSALLTNPFSTLWCPICTHVAWVLGGELSDLVTASAAETGIEPDAASEAAFRRVDLGPQALVQSTVHSVRGKPAVSIAPGGGRMRNRTERHFESRFESLAKSSPPDETINFGYRGARVKSPNFQVDDDLLLPTFSSQNRRIAAGHRAMPFVGRLIAAQTDGCRRNG